MMPYPAGMAQTNRFVNTPISYIALFKDICICTTHNSMNTVKGDSPFNR